MHGEMDSDAASPREAPAESVDVDNRLKLALAHALAGIAALSLFAAADAWRIATELGIASLLSVLAAIPAGIVFSTLVHEWSHLAGARLGGSAYRIPRRLGLSVLDYDYRANSLAQFELMSWAGQIGSVLAVMALWIAMPMNSAGRVMLVCAALGSGLFGALIEWPVIASVRQGGDALAELGRIDRALLYRRGSMAAAVAFALWLVAS